MIHCTIHHYEAENEQDPRYIQHVEKFKNCNWTSDFNPLKDCMPPKKQEKVIEKIKVKGKIGDVFVESIFLDDIPYFLCSKQNDNTLFTMDKIKDGNITYLPLSTLQPYDHYSYTSEEINQFNITKPTKEQLLDSVSKQIDHFIVATPIAKTLTTVDLFLSYCMEHIDTVHFPFYVGENESGKSSCAHAFKNLGYRPLYSLDITTPNIYQFLGQDEEGQGIIVEDEAQEIYRDSEKIRLYKGAYSRGSKIVRIVGADGHNRAQMTFLLYGLKVFAGEKLPHDKGILERLAVVKMIEGTPEGNIKRLTSLEKQELVSLRKAMLAWKVQNYWIGLPQITTDLKNRDRELWEDFLRVAYGTKYYDDATRVVKYYTNQRHDAIHNSLESKLFRIIINRLDDKLEINIQELWSYIVSSDNDILHGKLEGAQTFKLDEFSDKLTLHKIVSLIKDKFNGSPIERTAKGDDGKYHVKTSYSFKAEPLLKLVDKYGIEIPSLDHPLYEGQKGQNSHDLADQSDHYDQHVKCYYAQVKP